MLLRVDLKASARQTIFATPVDAQLVVVAVADSVVVIELELFVVELVELLVSTSVDLQDVKRLPTPRNRSRTTVCLLFFIM